MIRLYDGGVYLVNGTEFVPEQEMEKVRNLCGQAPDKADARKGTIAWSILKDHNTSEDMEHLRLRFDAMASHDITFVGIIQTAKASGMKEFPLPCAMTKKDALQRRTSVTMENILTSTEYLPLKKYTRSLISMWGLNL